MGVSVIIDKLGSCLQHQRAVHILCLDQHFENWKFKILPREQLRGKLFMSPHPSKPTLSKFYYHYHLMVIVIANFKVDNYDKC